MPSSIKIKDIRIDGGTQSRTKLNERHLSHLLEVLDEDGRLEPVEVIYDGVDYWLWDGFHRVETYRRAKRSSIPAHITQGTQRDAILKSCGANGKHGLPRCNADKRSAVARLLSDPEWSQWSTKDIAKACQVSTSFASDIRRSLFADSSEEYRTYVTKHGTVAQMRVNNIGKNGASQRQSLSDEELSIVAKSMGSDCIYVVHAADQYKIGFSANVVNRINALKSGNPNLRLIHVIPCNGQLLEKKLHEQFAAFRGDGEWFALPPAAVEWLKAIADEMQYEAAPKFTQEEQALHAAGIDDSTSPDEPVQRKTADGHWITEDGLILRYIPGSDRGWCPRCADWSNFMLMGQDTWACKKCDWRVQDDAIRIWEPEQPDPIPHRPTSSPTIVPDNMLTDLQEAQRLLRKWWERLPSTSMTRTYVDQALVNVGKAIVSAGKAPASAAFGKPAERIHQ